MSDDRGNAHLWLRNNVLALAAIFIAAGGMTIAAQAATDADAPNAKKAKKKKKVKRGPPGPQGPQGPQGIQGPPGPATGQAGGALDGNYPNPLLNVIGGPCPNGQALTDVSSLAALTCATGVYRDIAGNIGVSSTPYASLTSGEGNVAVGEGALELATDGSDNAALGGNALDANTMGTANSAVGLNALGANTTGILNSALGQGALAATTTGSSNTAVGSNALAGNTGEDNTALGNLAGSALTMGSDNIAIGNVGVAAESNTIRIGSFLQHSAFIAGIRGVTTQNTDAVPVLIDSAGQLGTVSSSRRLKEDIQPIAELRRLMKLKPVSFRWRSGPSDVQYGLIAEQVARVLPELAVHGDDGRPETVQYQDLPVLLLAQNQALQRQVNRQQSQINRLIKEMRGR